MYRQQGSDSFGNVTHDDNIGYFAEKEFKHEFTYRLTKDEWALKNGFKHEIDCVNNESRFCNVKKTRAYVCTDEGSDGKPVVETWIISKHITF